MGLSLFFTGCSDNEDDGSRGFMTVATIMGDPENGYYCYLDGGGLAISYDAELNGIERGYFLVSYMEDDRVTSADGVMYIDNAHIRAWSVYDVIRPLSKEEAEIKQIIGNDDQVPPRFSISRGYRGYLDFDLGNTAMNNGIRATVNMVYDPAQQTADTLLLQLYYNPNVSVHTLNTSNDNGSMSCDLSSLATLQQWRDSVVVRVDAGDKKEHLVKIGKDDFLKPDVKTE